MSATVSMWEKRENCLVDSLSKESPLQAYVEVKRLIKILEAAEKALLFKSERMTTDPVTSEYVSRKPDQILDCSFMKNTPPDQWKYSNDVVKAEIDLKALKEKEKATGVAINLGPKSEGLPFKVMTPKSLTSYVYKLGADPVDKRDNGK